MKAGGKAHYPAWRNFSTAENWVRYRSDRNRLKAIIGRAQVAADVSLSNHMDQENRRFFGNLNHFREARNSIQRIKKDDGSDLTDVRGTVELCSEPLRNVYKADDYRPEPMVEARQLVNQMAALAFTHEAYSSVTRRSKSTQIGQARWCAPQPCQEPSRCVS